MGTSAITADSVAEIFRDATGIWCAPGSPYENTFGALAAIKHARTTGKAFLGTCGGFQHALMEFAQNVLLRLADHAELTPAAANPLIVKLSCSLVGTQGRVIVPEPGRFADILGVGESVEEFNCNYGVNDRLVEIFQGSALRFVAHDEAGKVRAFRLEGHPFFAGTLFSRKGGRWRVRCIRVSGLFSRRLTRRGETSGCLYGSC